MKQPGNTTQYLLMFSWCIMEGVICCRWILFFKSMYFLMFIVFFYQVISNGPLAIYVKLRVVHAPGMPRTFSPPSWISDPGMHHVTYVTHVPWCMPGSLTSGFLWSRWWGKRSRHSRRMHNPQFYVSGKRPMGHWIRLRQWLIPSDRDSRWSFTQFPGDV